jgi:hypothetical protein
MSFCHRHANTQTLHDHESALPITMPPSSGKSTVEHQLNNNGSSGETCGFALHVLIVLTAAAFVLQFLGEMMAGPRFFNKHFYLQDVWSVLPDRWLGILAGRLFIGALVATPSIYFGVNSQAVPKLDSLDSLSDDFTRTCTPANDTDTPE